MPTLVRPWTPPDPALAPRMHTAWQKLLALLSDAEMHPWDDLLQEVAAEAAVQPQTAVGLLRAAQREGWVTWDSRCRPENRLVRLSSLALAVLGVVQ